MTPNMNFTLEEETHNSINFLSITITKKNDHLSFTVYRKPTPTDPIIPIESCHPAQHKLAAIRFVTNRRDTYSLDDTNKQIENKIINQILHNNK
jgi:DNA-directed RNA polymerase subunit L